MTFLSDRSTKCTIGPLTYPACGTRSCRGQQIILQFTPFVHSTLKFWDFRRIWYPENTFR